MASILFFLVTSLSHADYTKTQLGQMADRYGKCAALFSLGREFSDLPQEGTQRFQSIVSDVAEAMDRDSGTGFALIDLRPYISEKNIDALFSEFPVASEFSLSRALSILEFGKIYVEQSDSVWKFPLQSKATSTFLKLTNWLSRVTETALPKEFTPPEVIEVRILTPDGGTRFERWHPDGPKLNIILTLKGHGTWVKPRAKNKTLLKKMLDQIGISQNPDGSFEVPRGVAMIFTGLGRKTRATVHKSPKSKEDRMVVILRTEE